MMKKLLLAILLISSPAWAQTKPLPRGATARIDNCAPIGRTEDGKLVYSMKCEHLPAPPPAPPQAETREVPAPEPGCNAAGSSAGPMRERDRASSNGFLKATTLYPAGRARSPFAGSGKRPKIVPAQEWSLLRFASAAIYFAEAPFVGHHGYHE